MIFRALHVIGDPFDLMNTISSIQQPCP